VLGDQRRSDAAHLRQPLTWIAVALMLTGAVMLVTDVGAAGLWIAVITIGIALVAIEAYRHRHGSITPETPLLTGPWNASDAVFRAVG
jgi:hypothetical protein